MFHSPPPYPRLHHVPPSVIHFSFISSTFRCAQSPQGRSDGLLESTIHSHVLHLSQHTWPEYEHEAECAHQMPKIQNGVWLNRVHRFARFPARLAVGSPVVSLPTHAHFPPDCICYTLLRPHETLSFDDATLVLTFLLTLPLFRRTGLRPRQGLQRCQFLQ